MRGRRWLVWIVGVGILAQVTFVIPGVTLFLLFRQDTERDRTTHLICERQAADRTVTLDLIDFMTKPSDVDPASLDDPLAAKQLERDNSRNAEIRAYAHNHLPPIDCGG